MANYPSLLIQTVTAEINNIPAGVYLDLEYHCSIAVMTLYSIKTCNSQHSRIFSISILCVPNDGLFFEWFPGKLITFHWSRDNHIPNALENCQKRIFVTDPLYLVNLHKSLFDIPEGLKVDSVIWGAFDLCLQFSDNFLKLLNPLFWCNISYLWGINNHITCLVWRCRRGWQLEI